MFEKFTPWLKASGTVEQGNERETMEDRILMTRLEFEKRNYYLFLVCDGHGGDEVAEYIVQNFATTFQSMLKIKYSVAHLRNSLEKTFTSLHEQVRHLKSGSTLSLLIVVHDPLTKEVDVLIANVGDSTIYAVRETRQKTPAIRKISLDHNLQNKKERTRVENLEDQFSISPDNYVMLSNGSGINMTRSIGDHDFPQALLPCPTIRHVKTRYSTIILSSDGVWDVVSAKELWAHVAPKKWKDSSERVNKWRNATFRQHDNTSMILVFFDWQALQ